MLLAFHCSEVKFLKCGFGLRCFYQFSGEFLVNQKKLKSLKNLTINNLGEAELADLDDSASISLGDTEIVISTDSYIVTPIFFPGDNH
jgi:hypothetical protein